MDEAMEISKGCVPRCQNRFQRSEARTRNSKPLRSGAQNRVLEVREAMLRHLPSHKLPYFVSLRKRDLLDLLSKLDESAPTMIVSSSMDFT